ncbi:MAG: helix-turn-helix transcriptional regulator [Gammaproteobacteria bacterium]|nr:helix-turn-helix transcriptional regulator [Gammaproteobacteria bacterium]
MSDQDVYERILALLHEAVLEDAKWPAVSGLIDTACKSKGNILVFGEGTAESGVEIYFSMLCYRGLRCRELEHEYFQDYYPSDERIPRLRQLPDSYIVHINELITEEEKKVSRTYNEAFSRTSMQDCLNVRLDGPDSGTRIVMSVADSVDGSWSGAQVRMLGRLLPHIRHYVGARQALADARALGSSVVGLLDNVLTGVIQLDAWGQIVALNDRAFEVLDRGDGLSDEGGFVKATSKDDQARLEQVLARALPRLEGVGESGSMVVDRADALSRLVLHVTPVKDPQGEGRPRRVAALMLVVDPSSPARIDPAMLQWMCGFTPAESQLAAMLAEGRSVHDVAALTKRSEGTVRWHLKQIFRKTGLSRQVEVVQLVLSLTGLPVNQD